jgi:hypothetical protein
LTKNTNKSKKNIEESEVEKFISESIYNSFQIEELEEEEDIIEKRNFMRKYFILIIKILSIILIFLF